MNTHAPLSGWLHATRDLLHENWSKSLAQQAQGLASLAKREAAFAHAHELLLTLGDLVHHPAPGSGTADDHFKSVLRDLRGLQSEQNLSAAEVVFLLFTLRDTLKNVSNSREPEQASASPPFTLVTQLSSLLSRLGLVFFELSAAPIDAIDPPPDSNVEYALRYERARQMAITDSLTGLHNFGYFRDRLSEERRRAERYQRLLSLILFDLDHFKRYNDTHGHPAGNEVLRSVAVVLRHEARETDLVARYGGEELVIVLPETNRKTAWDVAERIRQRVRETEFHPTGTEVAERVTLSAGVATFPVDATHEDQLIERADASLYRAKASGRDRVVAYDPPHKVSIVYRAEPWVEHVALVGNFNNWDKEADPMQRRPDGTFEFVISLNPGDYRYKFVLNGDAWTPDPANQQTQPDNMGGVNSVLRVTEEARVRPDTR